jgi:hypothetical protein
MAITTYTVIDNNASASNFYGWAHPISAFFATAGWVQSGDTGQGVWFPTLVAITTATGNGATATYTYTVSQGAPLTVGGSIHITGFSVNPGFNGLLTILTLPTGNTFTTATAVNATETIAALGMTDIRQSLTNCTGNGSTNTYTYTDQDGVLRVGHSVIVTGFATAGFNGTFIVGSLGAGTFTTTTGISHAIETPAPAGMGLVTRSSNVPPGTSTNWGYEVWKMGDALQSTLPVLLKIIYGNTGSNNEPFVSIRVGPTTDGAGNFTGNPPATMNICNGSGGDNASRVTYLSGSTNRIAAHIFVNAGSSTGGFFSVERSHDATGADTGTYVLVCSVDQPAVAAEQVYSSSQVTANETKWSVLLPTGTSSGSFGSSTILSPVFPLAGTVGNPSINLLVGKNADWTDQTQFPFTLYNTSRNYIVFTAFNGAGTLTRDATITAVVMMRYD